MRRGQVERIARSNVCVDADLKFPVVALEAGGSGTAPYRGDIFKPHLPQFRRGHHHSREDIRIIPLLRQQLHRDGILFRAFFEPGNLVLAGIEQSDSVANIGHAHTDIRGSLPVHLHLKFRRVEVEAGIDVHKFQIIHHAAGRLLADLRELRELRSTDDRGNGKIDFTAKHRRQAHVVGHVSVSGKNSANGSGHLRVAAASLAARHQHDEKVRVIRWPVRIRLDERHLRQSNHVLGDILRKIGGFFERSAFGKRVRTD